jgi:hypothetical protein
MKKIHVAGSALAGILAVGAFQTKGVQSNSVGQTPASTANVTSPAAPGAPGSGNPIPPGAVPPAGQFNFADDQVEPVRLDLRPDQTVPTWVRIIYKEIPKPKGSAGYTQAPGQGKDAGKTASPRKGAAEKADAAKKTKPSAQATDSVSKQGQANDKSTSSAGPLSLKFTLDLNPTNFSACTTTVATLVADGPWNLGDERGIPISVTSCSPNGGPGKLTIANSSGVRRELTVFLNPRQSPWLQKALQASLGAAVLVSLICALVVWLRGHKMRDQIGEASWDFSTSWASNITVFGTALTFLLGWAAFPDKPFYGSKLEYTFLAGFAGALVAVAPAIHRMMSKGIASTDGDSAAAPAQGFVGGFLTASAFTMWGALLQVCIGLLIVCELRMTVTVYDPIGEVVAVAVGLTGVGLIVYSVTTILATVGGNAERSGTPGTTQKISATLTAEAPARAKRMKMPIAVL